LCPRIVPSAIRRLGWATSTRNRQHVREFAYQGVPVRVNARLDEESQQQIDYLTATTGMGVSQVLRESVALYYRQERARVAGARHLLALVGKGRSGRADIASDVKRHIAEGLAAKHGVPARARRAGPGA